MITQRQAKINAVADCYLEALNYMDECEAEEHARKMAESHSDSAIIEQGIEEGKKQAKMLGK